LALNNTSRGGLKERSRILLSAIAITLGLILMQTFLSRVVLRAEKNHIEFKLFLHDLTGIYVKTGALEFPPFLLAHPGFDTAYIRQKYDYTTFDNIWWNSDNKSILPAVIGDKEVRTTFYYWVKAIAKHPVAYFRIRTRGYLYFLRILKSGSSLTIKYPVISHNKYGFKLRENALCSKLMQKIEERMDAFYFQPYFWLFLNIILIALAFIGYVRKIRGYLLCLLTSSLFFVLFEYLVFPADTEFRYFYWNCISVSLAAILFSCEFICGLLLFTPGKPETET
jgi:hypothetical protein